MSKNMPIKSPKILIIEDEKFISKAYQLGFAHEGFKTVAAYDGKEGLEMAKKEKPDLILLDIIMPVMDGLTMLASCANKSGERI